MGAFQGKPVAKCEEGNQNLSALADLMGTPPAAAEGGDPLAGLGAALGEPGSGGGGGGGGGGGDDGGLAALGDLKPIAPVASRLPNPGKLEEAERDSQMVLEIPTYTGLEFKYVNSPGFPPNAMSQLNLTHEINMGGEGEGYRLTTMYSGSGGKVLMQGVTDTKLGLQGVAMFTDFLPGATFKFHPVLGQGPNGDINQGVFDLSYKGGDWCAAVKAGPQTNGEASWHQQLSQHWSAGVKVESMVLVMPKEGEQPKDFLTMQLSQMIPGLKEEPYVVLPKAEAAVRYSS